MRRQLLQPIGTLPVAEVVRRLCGVQAQVASSAELAVRLRRQASRHGEVARALADGRLIKTWAMRGTLHLLAPEQGGALLSPLAAGRSWERPGWRRYLGVDPTRFIDALRGAVREALENGPLTRDELIAAVIARPELSHVGEALRSGWGTLLKPLAWQGELCFGPSRGTRVTFMRPEAASSRWAGIPDPDEVAPDVIAAYLGAYGPASFDNFRNWLAKGRISARQMRGWFELAGDRLAEIEVDGRRAYVLAEDVDELASAEPTDAVRLLPSFDQYVMGVGTEDGNVIPPRRRDAVSRRSGWIAPIVVAGGVICGTWSLEAERLHVSWFKEAGRTPRSALQAEVARVSSILDRALRPVIETSRTWSQTRWSG